MDRQEIEKRYGILGNVRMMMRDFMQVDRRNGLILALDVVCRVAVPFLLVLIPGLIVEWLGAGLALEALMARIALLMMAALAGNQLRTYCKHRFERMTLDTRLLIHLNNLRRVALRCDMEQLEGEKNRRLMREAQEAFYDMCDSRFTENFVALIANVGGLMLYAAVASSLQWWLLAVLLGASLLSAAVMNWADRYYLRHMDAFWENTDRFWGLKRDCIDTKKAKDIRLYRLQPWFRALFDRNEQEAEAIYDDVYRHTMYATMLSRGAAVARDLCVYGCLIAQMISGGLSVSQFLIALGVAAGIGQWMQDILRNVTLMRHHGKGLSVYRYLLDRALPELGPRIQPPPAREIRMEDVTFGYDPEKPLLNHFNLTLREGEKLALVGMNGAGKTTLVKLLCGLYAPQQGRILYNGRDIRELPEGEYYQYVAVLFQDVNPLAFSIACNVSARPDDGTGDDPMDEARVIECLKRVDLWQKVSALPKGIYTSLTRKVDRDGVELSGGETQRLMLARALYKDAPVLILDEPTAALDPVAESRLYEEYARMCEGKISVFISHRLSSTRFCDRIVYLENGRIAEQGTHDALMAKNGRYARMFNIQAHYYQKKVVNGEAVVENA